MERNAPRSMEWYADHIATMIITIDSAGCAWYRMGDGVVYRGYDLNTNEPIEL